MRGNYQHTTAHHCLIIPTSIFNQIFYIFQYAFSSFRNRFLVWWKLRSINLVVPFSFLRWSISNSLIADFLIQPILFYYSHFYCSGLLTKMLANLPVEIVLLICEYPEFKDLGQLARTNKRMMKIIKKYLPTALERNILFYRKKVFPVWAKINFNI